MFDVEVLQDEGKPVVYQVDAPSEDDAIMLAFAMDGGFGSCIEDWKGALSLAKSYAMITRWDGKTKAQLEAELNLGRIKYKRINNAWEKWAGDREFYAIWSVDHTPDEIAFEGEHVIVAERDEFYGGPESDSYSCKLRNPTWAEVFLCFNTSMQVTRDFHHCFLEGIGPNEDGIWEFHTGS